MDGTPAPHRILLNPRNIIVGADADVATVANLCMKLAYNNKGANHGHGLSAAMICAGWDAQCGGQVRPSDWVVGTRPGWLPQLE